MKLAAIHHVAIIVSDYEKSKDFYVNKLGFEIVRENFREERNDWKLDLRVGEGADAIRIVCSLELNMELSMLISRETVKGQLNVGRSSPHSSPTAVRTARMTKRYASFLTMCIIQI